MGSCGKKWVTSRRSLESSIATVLRDHSSSRRLNSVAQRDCSTISRTPSRCSGQGFAGISNWRKTVPDLLLTYRGLTHLGMDLKHQNHNQVCQYAFQSSGKSALGTCFFVRLCNSSFLIGLRYHMLEANGYNMCSACLAAFRS